MSYDLLNTYANKTENISIHKFFETYIDSIVRNLRLINTHFKIDHKEITTLKDAMTFVVSKSIAGMSKEIEVHPDFIKNGMKSLKLTQLDNVKVHVRETTKENQNETISTIVKGKYNITEEVDINLIQSLVTLNNRNPLVINLDEYVLSFIPSFTNVFLPNIYFSRNIHLSKESLAGNYQDLSQVFVKPIHQLLLIREMDVSPDKPFYKIIIGSTKDFDTLMKMCSNPNHAFIMIPPKCTGWIIKANGELINPIGRDSFYSHKEVNSHVNYNRMLVQILFIGGNLFCLKQKEWIRELQYWLKTLEVDQRLLLKAWFEKSMRNYGLSLEYQSCPISKVWDV